MSFRSLRWAVAGGILCIVDANSNPEFEFHLEMKTPQLIGIVAGFVVFSLTVTSVIYLLVQSGSWGKFVEEMQSGKPLAITQAGTDRQAGKLLKDYPKLYDNLVEASRSLPAVISDVVIESNRMIVRNVNLSENSTQRKVLKSKNGQPKECNFNDLEELFCACNGSAIYHECSYDPMRLWMWHECGKVIPNPNAVVPKTVEEVPLVGDDTIEFPIGSMEEYASFLRSRCESSGGEAPVSVLCIVDKEFGRPVGSLDLVANSPKNLSVQLDNLWLTPAFQGKKFACEAVLLILTHLFNKLQYRRVSYEIDFRHTIGRKFLLKCGFKLEATLRKHRIVQERNRDSSVYVILNSDWPEVELALRKYCGMPEVTEKLHNIAEIDTIAEIAESIALQAEAVAGSRTEAVGASDTPPLSKGDGTSSNSTARLSKRKKL